MFCSAIIVAAGTGKRMKTKVTKQFLEIQGRPVVAHAIDKFQKCDSIDEIIIVTSKMNLDYCRKEIVEKYQFTKVSKVIAGGIERQFSVYNGLQEVNEKTSIVLVHDGVRPFVKIKDIEKTIKEAVRKRACVLGVKARDTIKICNFENKIIRTPDRNRLWAIQTPQTFEYQLLYDAYEMAKRDDFIGTDDSMLVERMGVQVSVIEGSYDNIKITTIEDMIVAEAIANRNRSHLYSTLS